MKTITVVLVCAAAFLVLCPTGALAQSGEELFQKAVQLETVKGELEQAIGVYKSIINKYASDQPLAAKSLLHMGRCYEKLGKEEATKAYERIIKEYASQPDVVAEARARLAALAAGAKVGGGLTAQKLLSRNGNFDYDGSWILTPSPDGHWIAYTNSKDELRIRNLESGEEKELVPAEPQVENGTALWSADGKRLAYGRLDSKTKHGTIEILDLVSGKSTTVLNSGEMQLDMRDWSRDGRFLLCTDRQNTLHVVNIEDGTVSTLSDSVWWPQRASFSPDGRFVTYASGPHGQETAYIEPITGGPRHSFAKAQENQSNSYLHPLWSPDGSEIAYQQPDGIWLVPVKNGEASGPARLAYKTSTDRWICGWAASGGFYLTYVDEKSVPYMVTVDPTTGKPSTAAPETIPDAPQDATDFAWTPDARHIAYTGWEDKIKVYSIDTKIMTEYNVGRRICYRPSRSGGAREVYFEVGDPATRKSNVSVLDIESGKTRDLFPPMQKFIFSFSSDGQRMLAVKGSQTGAEVTVGRVGGTDGRLIASGKMGFPELSPKGDRALIIRKGEATPECGGANGFSLWVVASDSSATRRIASAWGISTAVWDPTGRFIAYLAQTDSGVHTRDLRFVDATSGDQMGNVLLGESTGVRLTDWSGDGRHVGFYTTEPWREYWVIGNLQEGGK